MSKKTTISFEEMIQQYKYKPSEDPEIDELETDLKKMKMEFDVEEQIIKFQNIMYELTPEKRYMDLDERERLIEKIVILFEEMQRSDDKVYIEKLRPRILILMEELDEIEVRAAKKKRRRNIHDDFETRKRMRIIHDDPDEEEVRWKDM
jgi:hypothetical protein